MISLVQIVNTSQNVQDDIHEYTKNVQPPVLRQQDGHSHKADLSSPDSGVEVDFPDPLHYRGPPLASVYCSAQLAKNLAQDNLKHQPLPDTIEDALYR